MLIGMEIQPWKIQMIPTKKKTIKKLYSWMWIRVYMCMFVKTINRKISDQKMYTMKCDSVPHLHSVQLIWFNVTFYRTTNWPIHFSTNQLLSKTNNICCVSLALKAKIQSLHAHTHYSTIENLDQQRVFLWYRNIIEVFEYFHLSWNFFHFQRLFIWFVFAYFQSNYNFYVFCFINNQW